MLDCFLAASCTCNDSDLCKSSRISFPTSWKRHKFCKVLNTFVISIELGFTTGCIIFFTVVFVWGPFSRPFKAWNFSPKIFILSFRLTEDMLLPEWCWKKKEQTSEQSFVNAVINIWMPEMNSMIHSKTSSKCSR